MLNSWSLIDCHVELVCTLHAGPGNAERSAVLWFSICPILTSEHNVFIIENISCRFYFMTALVFSSRFCHTSTHTNKKRQNESKKKRQHTHEKQLRQKQLHLNASASLFILLYFPQSNTFRFSVDEMLLDCWDKICRHSHSLSTLLALPPATTTTTTAAIAREEN